MNKQCKPYGTWPSDLSAELVAAGGRRFAGIQGDGAWVYWTEGRPAEQGRQVIMRARPGANPEELLPAPYSARSRLHEYGGGEFLVDDGVIYFTNNEDQDLYVLVPGGQPERLTNEPQLRLANCRRDAKRKRLIAVAERAPPAGEQNPQNLLVCIALTGSSRGKVSEVTSGHDFYAAPTLSPDGKQLAWLAWDLPDMPWDQAGLYVANLSGSGQLDEPQLIAGADGSATFQPEWTGGGKLIYVCDKTDWGNLYIWDGESSRAITDLPADFIRPLWQLGMRSYALLDDTSLIASYFDKGEFKLAQIEIEDGTLSACPVDLAELDAPTRFERGIAGLAGRNEAPPAIVAMTTALTVTSAQLKSQPEDNEAQPEPCTPIILRSAADIELNAGSISRARVETFPGGDGQDSFGLYYPPTNASYDGPDDALPPAIITVHGGPTASADRGLKMTTQFFTSRGFAVFDLDYAGSAYYGRAYRKRLDGEWGIADVADCRAAAKHLAQAGLADPAQLIIRGGSAGGYSVLMALATTDIFAAGSCHYGISDLSLLLDHTHKFESGYLNRLLGLTRDNSAAILRERSPLTLIDNISRPVILFQGLDDKVVPPPQSQLIVAKLREKGLDVAYHEFEGEGHGFRRADTIITVLNEDLAFMRRVLRLRTERA